jgi:copper chaperone
MTSFSVPDMNCNHCKATIEKALAAVPGVGRAQFDLERHVLTTQGTAPASAVIAALAEVDYAATVLAV